MKDFLIKQARKIVIEEILADESCEDWTIKDMLKVAEMEATIRAMEVMEETKKLKCLSKK